MDYQSKFNLNRKPLVLIVDDVPENLQVLGSMIYDKGIDVAFATSGKQALATVETNIPDLILLDIFMPGMDGFAVCEQLKGSPSTNGIPIIFLTASNQTEDVIKGFDVGGVDYVTKPFNSGELITKIFTHLELKLFREHFSKSFQPSLSARLQNELMELWKEAKTTLIISKVKEFATEVKAMGDEYKISNLTKYGIELLQQADSVKIDKIIKTLARYPELVKSVIS